ncbi:McrB family protein [Parafilimonas terrae]|uniref:AAA domain (Dynein-related subfamily) n=1 Tax=Parafilimonas terrae TaxID=1465490 RepID=A0A1I5W732_9BACT|nr:AAA family ATPase [Parafilimonas terrae]SFQ15562.1 AAA domain (dynein-related subfamily) [Parafilimonas terrae]
MSNEINIAPNYFIFGNKPPGEYEDSFWDTSTILETKEYYFTTNDNLTYKPKRGDVIIFKEFNTKIYWGQAVIDSDKEEVKQDADVVIRFKLKDVKIWLYKLDTDAVYNSLSNKDTRARIVSITKTDFNLIISTMESKSPLSVERQTQIKALWEKYKLETKAEDKDFNNKEIETLIAQWQQYKDKITNGTLSLDDYTNILGNASATMPGGYLCNFLERTTRTVLGSSKPGTAFNFEVKLNNDNITYYILKQNKQNASRAEAESHFNDNIKGLLKSIVSETDPLAKIRIVEDATYSAKQILMKMAVLDNLSDFLYIYSTQWLEELYNDFIDGDAEGIFTKNHQVCLVAKKLLAVNEQDKGELILLSRFLWRYVNAKTIADTDNPNVIMYGPPGTGKTFTVVNNLDFVSQGDSSRYEVLQFHPSFTYEDFIEGIKPKGVSQDGNIRFELVNGVFKNFCIKAKNNPGKAFYFVVDEINRANLSSVFGETLSLLEKDYRHDGKGSKNLIKTQYSALIEDLIREDDKYKSLAYAIDNGEVKFGVPENVFFIGMMNDVDKSIDAFDLALRRRFKWIRKDCDYEVVEEETRFKRKEDFSNIGQYIKACEKLNNYISSDLGLGKSYEFGHSFFMKMSDIAKRKEITQHNLEVLFNLYLRPTLKEYLRAVFAESELDNKLNEALNRFKETLK